MKIKSLLVAMMAISTLFLSSCSDDDNNDDPAPEMKGSMFIKFDHVWGPSQTPFALNTELVHPASGDTLEFTKLRYYISNIVLHNANGSDWAEVESYHLVEAGAQAGIELELPIDNVPAGNYTGISYMIGVDSLRNVSGAQEGALDPAEEMFWSWNTGYIFIKAEGQSNVAPNGTFTYHLGGFQGAEKAIQENYHDFQGGLLEIVPDANPSVHLTANAARFWHGGISTAQTPMVHMPGSMAVTLATNFGGGFAFDHIHN